MVDDTQLTHIGTVCWFNPQGGYGFISYEINDIKQKDMFCHFSDIAMEGFKTLYKNQKVSFNIGTNIRGEPKAVNIMILQN